MTRALSEALITVKSHFFAVTIFSRFKTSRYHDFAILGSRKVMVNMDHAKIKSPRRLSHHEDFTAANILLP